MIFRESFFNCNLRTMLSASQQQNYCTMIKLWEMAINNWDKRINNMNPSLFGAASCYYPQRFCRSLCTVLSSEVRVRTDKGSKRRYCSGIGLSFARGEISLLSCVKLSQALTFHHYKAKIGASKFSGVYFLDVFLCS